MMSCDSPFSYSKLWTTQRWNTPKTIKNHWPNTNVPQVCHPKMVWIFHLPWPQSPIIIHPNMLEMSTTHQQKLSSWWCSSDRGENKIIFKSTTDSYPSYISYCWCFELQLFHPKFARFYPTSLMTWRWKIDVFFTYPGSLMVLIYMGISDDFRNHHTKPRVFLVGQAKGP